MGKGIRDSNNSKNTIASASCGLSTLSVEHTDYYYNLGD